MANRLFAAEDNFPGFTGKETQEEKVDRILSYVHMLNEQYRYILSRLNTNDEES